MTRIPALFVPPALLAFALTGCLGSDFVLVAAPPPVAEEPSIGAASTPSSPGGANADDSPSMWDGLADLVIPEEYWFVNWMPTSGPCEGDACWTPRFDAVDVLGRVVASFEHPAWDEGSWSLGAGDFDVVDVVAGPDGTAYVSEVPRTYAASSLEHFRYVWRADAVTGTANWVLAIDPDGVLHLPGLDAKFALGTWLQDVRMVPDPTEPNVLWLLALDSIYYGVHGSVVRLDLTSGESTSWPLDKTLDAELTSVFAMQAVPTDEGTALLLGLVGLFDDDDAGVWASRIITFAADGSRLGQDLDVSGIEWFDRAVVAEGTQSADDVTVLLQAGGSVYGGGYCGGEPLRVVNRTSVVGCDRHPLVPVTLRPGVLLVAGALGVGRVGVGRRRGRGGGCSGSRSVRQRGRRALQRRSRHVSSRLVVVLPSTRPTSGSP